MLGGVGGRGLAAPSYPIFIVRKHLIPPDIILSEGIDFFAYINNNMVI